MNYLIQGSATGVPVGQVANFVAGLLFVLPVSYMFRRFKTAKGVTIGLVTGTVVMTVLMAVLNYYVFYRRIQSSYNRQKCLVNKRVNISLQVFCRLT